jgi:hypothetical protein
MSNHFEVVFIDFSALIFDSSVVEGTPSLAAAPDDRDTRPLASASAASIVFRSSDSDILNIGRVS